MPKEIIKVDKPWVMNETGRKATAIFYSDGSRKVTSYARYLYEQHYGPIPDDMEVDHIDEDCTNDDISNLQLLTPLENVLKNRALSPAETMIFDCGICGREFECFSRIYRHNQVDQNKAGPFCSKSCAGKYSKAKQIEQGSDFFVVSDPITKEMSDKYDTGEYSFRKLAEEYGLHHSTVMYRIKQYKLSSPSGKASGSILAESTAR